MADVALNRLRKAQAKLVEAERFLALAVSQFHYESSGDPAPAGPTWGQSEMVDKGECALDRIESARLSVNMLIEMRR